MDTAQVDDIPVLVARPSGTGFGGRLTLWMHFLGMKDACFDWLVG